MNDLLINIFCPPTSKSYDFWIPKGINTKAAINLICDDICAFENNPGLFTNRSKLVLCSYINEKTLSPEATLEQEGIRSGDRLALV